MQLLVNQNVCFLQKRQHKNCHTIQLFLTILFKKNSALCYRDIFSSMFTAILFTLARKWNLAWWLINWGIWLWKHGAYTWSFTQWHPPPKTKKPKKSRIVKISGKCTEFKKKSTLRKVAKSKNKKPHVLSHMWNEKYEYENTDTGKPAWSWDGSALSAD